MKYLIFVIVICLGLIFNIIPLDIPRLTIDNPVFAQSIEGASEEVSCTDVGVHIRGFPVRINGFDECGVNSTTNALSVLINCTFWSVLAFSSVLIYGRFRKNT